MWPDFLARMPGSTAAIPCNTPRIFTSIMRFHSSTLTSWRGERGMMPALFTSTSTDAKGGERFDVSEAGDVDRAACRNAAGFPNLRSNLFQPILAARAKDH